jgi:hypothetical protein
MHSPFPPTGTGEFTLERARAGFDHAFERRLVEVITKAIAEASAVSDANAVVLRTGEMIGALTTTVASTIALSPHARSPTALRRAADEISKRIRRQVLEALADPGFQEDRAHFSDDNEAGHA